MSNIYEITESLYKEWLNSQSVLFYCAIKKARKDFLKCVAYFITYIRDYTSYKYVPINVSKCEIRRFYD